MSCLKTRQLPILNHQEPKLAMLKTTNSLIMTYWIKPPYWFNILIGTYLGLNVLFAVFLIAVPLVIAGPSSILSSFQLWGLMVIFHLIKTITSWYILKGKRKLVIILPLAIGSIWSYWLGDYYSWETYGTEFFILDCIILVSTTYIFVINRSKVVS